MRIALISETFLPKVDGVVTRLIQTLPALQRLGHEVLVVAPPRAPERYAGARVVTAAGLPFPWYPEHTVALPRPGLPSILERFRPDVVQVVNPVLFGSWGALWAKRSGLPLVASFHTDPKVVRRLGLGALQRPLEVLDREVHNLAEVTLCTSPQMVALARGLGLRRVRLWPKAVDSVTFDPNKADTDMRARLSAGRPERPLVVYAGRVSFEKRVDVFADVVRRLPDVGFAVVGDGPATAWLRRELEGTQTVFTGFLSGDALARAYASADVFAFPSDSETLGFAALEAMAAGVAVVAARAGGVPHIVTHERNGLLVAPGDAPAFAEAVRRLLDDEELRKGLAAAGRREAERWSWDAATRTLVDYYREAIRLRRMSASRRRRGANATT